MKKRSSSVVVDKATIYNNPNISEELKTVLTLSESVSRMRKFKIVLWLVAAGRNGLNLDEICHLTHKGKNLIQRWVDELVEGEILTQFQATVKGVRYTLSPRFRDGGLDINNKESLSSLSLSSSEDLKNKNKKGIVKGIFCSGLSRARAQKGLSPFTHDKNDDNDKDQGIGEEEGNLQPRNYVPGLGGRSKPSPRQKLKASVNSPKDSLGYRPNPRNNSSGLSWQKALVKDWTDTQWVEYWAWKFRQVYGTDDPFVTNQHPEIIRNLGTKVIRFAQDHDWDSAKLREYIDWAFDYAREQPWMVNPLNIQALVKKGGHFHAKFQLVGVKAKRRRVKPTENWHPAGIPRPRPRQRRNKR
jgi:hypothetical protein